MRKKLFVAFSLSAVLGGGLIFFFVLPEEAERRKNAVARRRTPFAPSERAVALHKQLRIADLHADSLLWNRNLLQRASRGHVDVPRLIEGNVWVQAFTIVSKVPRGLNIDSNNGGSFDLITPLAIAERWPVAAWSSLKARALHQAEKLRAVAEGSKGKFVVIKTANELSAYLERRARERGLTAGLLGVEGAQVLEGDLRNLDVLFESGVRMIAPTHFFDNEIGGSAHGTRKGGLTELGKEMIRRMEAKGMILDLAHASAQTIDDAVRVATKPVIVSHTGVKGTCDNNRNLTDWQIKQIAQTGGLIGIGFWDTAVCGGDAKSIARAVRYTADLVGVRHVAFGSDFDGAVTVPFDASGLVELTNALLAEGFSDDEIKLIAGENVLRVLLANLPQN